VVPDPAQRGQVGPGVRDLRAAGVTAVEPAVTAGVIKVVAVDVDLSLPVGRRADGPHEPAAQRPAELPAADLVGAGRHHLVAELVLDQQQGQPGAGLRPQVVAVVTGAVALAEQADLLLHRGVGKDDGRHRGAIQHQVAQPVSAAQLAVGVDLAGRGQVDGSTAGAAAS
jgi:hypothetical protein